MLARVLSMRVAETTGGDFNDCLVGITYTADATTFSNKPSNIASGPTVIMFFGLMSAMRGIQVAVNVDPSNGLCNIYMRGAIGTGGGNWSWSYWNKISGTIVS